MCFAVDAVSCLEGVRGRRLRLRVSEWICEHSRGKAGKGKLEKERVEEEEEGEEGEEEGEEYVFVKGLTERICAVAVFDEHVFLL